LTGLFRRSGFCGLQRAGGAGPRDPGGSGSGRRPRAGRDRARRTALYPSMRAAV